MRWFQMRLWPPYVSGALIGVLCWCAFLTADRPIGVSTAIARTTGMFESLLTPQHVQTNPYFMKFKPAIDWEWMLVLGIALGAFLSSRLSGDKPDGNVPAVWRGRFGASRFNRYAAACVGGFLVMFGARVAGGCTSGHGISGSLQLALSGWVFFLSLFVSGLLTAYCLYGREGSRG